MYEGWEILMALKISTLCLKKMQYEMGSQCSFLRKGMIWLVLSSLKQICKGHFESFGI